MSGGKIFRKVTTMITTIHFKRQRSGGTKGFDVALGRRFTSSVNRKASGAFVALIFMSVAFIILVLGSVVGGVFLTIPSEESDAFISTWDTTQIVSHSSNDSKFSMVPLYLPATADDQIKLPLVKNGNYDFTVKWGDNTEDRITSWNQPEITHTYAEKGEYTVTITGTIGGWSFGDGVDALKIEEISQWGNLKWGNSVGYFDHAVNLNVTAKDVPNLNGTTTLANAFRKTGISSVPQMNNWDVSNVTDMSNMFAYTNSFNQDIGDWDVSSVNDMSQMFRGADAFDQNLGGWNVGSVQNMANMFRGAKLSTKNYDSLLTGWAGVDVQEGINFHGGESQYSERAADARQKLIDEYSWEITDGGRKKRKGLQRISDEHVIGGSLGKAKWPQGMEDLKVRFIRLQYRGGDWDQDIDKSADYNFLVKFGELTGFTIAQNTESIQIQELAGFPDGHAPPFVFITGSNGIKVSTKEVKILRKYLLEEGGMLFADNGGGHFNHSFRRLMRRVLPDKSLVAIPNDDIIYKRPYRFPHGAPPLWHHSGKKALGIQHNDRWVVFYHQGDINDVWKTGHSGAEKLAPQAYRLGVNVVNYAFNQYTSIHR